jgi:hypothetical protein
MSVAELLAILQRVMQFAEGPNYLVLVQDEDDEGCPITDCQVELVNKAVILNVNTRATPAGLPAPGPLPEAPVSITLKATMHGHEVLVTLRGTDFAGVQAQVEQVSQWLQAQPPM